MTEEIDIDNGNVIEDIPEIEGSSEASEAKTSSEKMYSAEHVKNVAKRNRHAGYKKGRQDAMTELASNMQTQPQAEIPAQDYAPQMQQPMQPQMQAQLGGIPVMSNEMREAIQQESLKAAHNLAQQIQAEQMLNDFTNKLMTARPKYSDFDDKVAGLQLHKLPPMLIQMSSKLENAGDVIYDLANNPHKIGQIMSLSAVPHLAELEMLKLSNSIKNNEIAKVQASQTNVKEPLDQPTPSNIATDNGAKSIRDLKRAKYLRA